MEKMKDKNQLDKPSLKMKFNFSEKKKKNEHDTIDRKLFLGRIIINGIASLILITTFCLLWTRYSPVWKIFFLLTIYSFWSNTFYIISITIIDILLYKGYNKCEKFNLLVRNTLIRIILPFSISTIIIYWELVLLGDKFQGIGHSVLDICKSFFLHGLVFAFMCFDVFTTKHINKNNNCKIDLIIISIIMAVHFALVILCKEALNVHPYDFLKLADTRQIFASFIIIYILVLNGYIVFYLISDYFFEKEEIKDNDDRYNKNNESGDKLNDNDGKEENIFSNLNQKNNIKINDVNEENIKKESINNREEEENKESIKEQKDNNENNLKEESQNGESDNYNISEKESQQIDIFEKKMEDYAFNVIKNSTLNKMNKINEDRELLNIKKEKFGIKDIKIPVNNNEININKK